MQRSSSVRHSGLTCQMRVDGAKKPHTAEHTEYLVSVANDLVKSFTNNHVTEERAEAIKLAFEDVLLVR